MFKLILLFAKPYDRRRGAEPPEKRKLKSGWKEEERKERNVIIK